MARINNSEMYKEIVEGAKIQISADIVPTELENKVTPVMECNPKLLKRIDTISYISGTSTGTTIITLQNKPFFLCAAYIDLQTDATDDSTTWEIRTTIKGVANTRILALRKLPSTATNKTIFVTFPNPIMIDAGVAISLTGGGTTGSRAYTAGIMGYYDDYSKA